jgi:AcrR family transcriptional regulator
MSSLDETTDTVDGRVARRQRNIDVVLDVVLDMFGEEAMFPTMEQVANRAGLSLRSLYRYFANPAELLEAAIKHSQQYGYELAHLPAIGRGPLEGRIEAFVAMRLKVHEHRGAVYRATIANSVRHSRIRQELAKHRSAMRDQFEVQFAPELAGYKSDDREAILTAGDVLTQLESIDYLRRARQLSVAEAQAALTTGLRALFA